MSKYDVSREDYEFGRDLQMDEDDRRVERDLRRQTIVEQAVQSADEFILEASDGSREMTDYLTTTLAQRLHMESSRPLREAFHRKRGTQYRDEDFSKGPIETATRAALVVISAGTDGSPEERNWLVSMVALRFAEKAHIPFQSALLKKDIGV